MYVSTVHNVEVFVWTSFYYLKVESTTVVAFYIIQHSSNAHPYHKYYPILFQHYFTLQFFFRLLRQAYGILQKLNLQKLSTALWFVHFDIQFAYPRQRLAIFAHCTFKNSFPAFNFKHCDWRTHFSWIFLHMGQPKKYLPGPEPLEMCFARQRRAILRLRGFLNILNCECASHHRSVRLLDISSIKKKLEL